MGLRLTTRRAKRTFFVPAALAAALATACGEVGAGRPSARAEMLALLESAVQRSASRDPYLGESVVAELRAELRDAELTPQARSTLLGELGFHELRLGENDAAVAHYEDAVETLSGEPREADAEALAELRFGLGLAYLRWGETNNCVARHTSESCLLPIRGSGVHVDQRGSRRALDVFAALLEERPDDVVTRWLLNVAYMTVGGYPDAVPPRFLVPPESFEAREPFPRFVDVAPERGLNTFDMAGGAVVDDFDGDGDLDLVTSTWHPAGRLHYFAGDGRGGFEERSERSGLADVHGGLNLAQGDCDGDGAPDLLVLRGAWLGADGRVPNALLRNSGAGSFRDVTVEAGMGAGHYPTQTAAWADCDNDGDLDVYVGNECSPALYAPSQLFRNRGDGSFDETAARSGVLNRCFAKGVAWGDYDGDGLQDLYVSNLGAPNRLYRNAGPDGFDDVAAKAGVVKPIDGFATWFWDFDNDGVLDLFAASYQPSMANVASEYLGLPSAAETARLYRGDGRGGFEDATARAGLDRVACPMGANFGDLDNDGFLDFYLGTGYPGYEGLMPNLMFRNRGGESFVDVTTAGGFGHLQKGHGVAFADLDRDGDQDVFLQVGGAYPGDAFGNALFENPGSENHWIAIQAVGTRSVRSAVGARIRCDVREDGVARSIFRHVASGGSFGCNPLRQHVGLGRAKRIDRLEVHWPATGVTQVFSDVPADRHLRVVEGADRYEEL